MPRNYGKIRKILQNSDKYFAKEERTYLMKLTKNQLVKISHGAVRVTEENRKVSFFRFTKEQQELYKNTRRESFYLKTFTTAGIRFEFQTDSSSLFVKVNVPFVTSRSYFAVDVCVNGETIGSINNFDGVDMTGDYTKKNYPLGSFSKNFELGCGEKTVTIYLPWSVPVEIEEVSVDDGAFVNPVAKNKKILVLGDSITQGYDTLHPSKHHIAVLSDILEAEVYNKAIGGERFIPSLVKTDEDYIPDYIIAAYGSNDWANSDRSRFESDCKEFYISLSHKYPSAKIFAITPIWRKDCNEQNICGSFSSVADYIKEVTKELDNVYCLNSIDLVLHREELYGDLSLHPNDEGFAYYADSVCSWIKNIID